MKKFLFAMMALLLVGMLAGCGSEKKEAPKQAAAATLPKVIVVGTEPGFAPFEFQKKDAKEFDGFDMDLMRAIGKQMKVEVKLQGMGFDALIPALESKQINACISGMTITDERAKKVRFSKPYYKSGLSIVVRKEETKINSLKDLEGKAIGVQIGTTGAIQAGKVKNAKVKNFNVNGEACLELKNKGVDAVIGDLPVEQWFLKNGGAAYAKIVGDVLTAEDYGIAVRKDDKVLGDAIDKALAELKANGEYDKLYKKWFGSAPKK